MIDANNMRTAHTINYVEGYATGASYFADLGQPVVVCFDAYNLTPVAKTISGYFPSAKHVFIADADDSQTGEKEAVKAAQAVRVQGAQADVLIPKELGDYNDHAVEGELLPELSAQSRCQLTLNGASPTRARCSTSRRTCGRCSKSTRSRCATTSSRKI